MKMVKGDYHVIVYQILAYLYNCLKNGIDPDKNMISKESPLYDEINGRYWGYIIYTMYQMGLIDGITLSKAGGYKIPLVSDLEEVFITPRGIGYLTDDRFMEKAKQYLKAKNALAF